MPHPTPLHLTPSRFAPLLNPLLNPIDSYEPYFNVDGTFVRVFFVFIVSGFKGFWWGDREEFDGDEKSSFQEKVFDDIPTFPLAEFDETTPI